jgi:hypothetical protein
MSRFAAFVNRDWVQHTVIFFVLFAGVLAVWYFVGRKPAADWYPAQTTGGSEGSKVSDDAGKFGDSYGYVNSLLSSLAVVGVAYTLWLQIQANKASEKEHRENVRALALAAYLNGLHTSVIYYGDMEQTSKQKFNQQHWLFKRNLLIQDVTSLTERVRPAIEKYFSDSPMTRRQVCVRLKEHAVFLKQQILSHTADLQGPHRKVICRLAIDEVVADLSLLAPLICDVAVQDVVSTQLGSLKEILKRFDDGEDLLPEMAEALEKAADDFYSNVGRLLKQYEVP